MNVTQKNDAHSAAVQRPRQRGWRLAHWLMRPFFRLKYRYTCEPIDLPGPFLLIANHAANLDPILIGLSYRPKPLAYVASEHLERLGFLTRILTRYFDVIPRSKASSAVGTVKSVLKALRQGTSVVLFAEGDCTWDGVSAEVFPATGKLARTAQVPLVTYRLEGNYQSKPRWAAKARRGRITGSIAHIYSPEELAAMSGEEITAAINRDICVDAWQNETRFSARAPAAGLEQALFLCPKCGKPGFLFTKKDGIFCADCGRLARLDGGSHLSDSPFRTIRDWDLWQRKQLSAFLSELGKADPQNSGQYAFAAVLFQTDGVLSNLTDGVTQTVRVHLDLLRRAIVLNGEPLPFSAISDMAMVKTNRLLFAANSKYYELKIKRGILRPYLLTQKVTAEETEATE